MCNLILLFITPSTTYLEGHWFCRKSYEQIFIRPMQGHFASLWKIIDEKDHLFSNFPLIVEIKKYPFFAPNPYYLPLPPSSNSSNPP